MGQTAEISITHNTSTVLLLCFKLSMLPMLSLVAEIIFWHTSHTDISRVWCSYLWNLQVWF